MKRFKVLEVNNKEENHSNYTSSYTISCTVEDLETDSVININNETDNELHLKIINKIGIYHLEVGDELGIK
jgi:hypothetical protein